jgi:hypothetical protein
LGAVGSPQITHLEDELGVELTRGLEVGKDVLEPSLNISVSLRARAGMRINYSISAEYPTRAAELGTTSAKVVEAYALWTFQNPIA